MMRPITGNGRVAWIGALCIECPFVAYLMSLYLNLGVDGTLCASASRVAVCWHDGVCVWPHQGTLRGLRLALVTAIFLHFIPLFAAGALLDDRSTSSLLLDAHVVVGLPRLSKGRATHWYAAGSPWRVDYWVNMRWAM